MRSDKRESKGGTPWCFRSDFPISATFASETGGGLFVLREARFGPLWFKKGLTAAIQSQKTLANMSGFSGVLQRYLRPIQVFSYITESESTCLQFGLDLLHALKEELGLTPSRKCPDFLLHACVSAKDLQSSLFVLEVFSKELKGAISVLASLQDHLLIASGPRIILHKWAGSDLTGVACFYVPPLYIRCELKYCPIIFMKRFPYKDIKRATYGFQRIMYTNSHVTVYKARFQNGGVVLIKEIRDYSQAEHVFYREVQLLGRLHHRHLLPLRGFSTGHKRCFVFLSECIKSCLLQIT